MSGVKAERGRKYEENQKNKYRVNRSVVSVFNCRNVLVGQRREQKPSFRLDRGGTGRQH